jgi:hypothetical protein
MTWHWQHIGRCSYRSPYFLQALHPGWDCGVTMISPVWQISMEKERLFCIYNSEDYNKAPSWEGASCGLRLSHSGSLNTGTIMAQGILGELTTMSRWQMTMGGGCTERERERERENLVVTSSLQGEVLSPEDHCRNRVPSPSLDKFSAFGSCLLTVGVCC